MYTMSLLACTESETKTSNGLQSQAYQLKSGDYGPAITQVYLQIRWKRKHGRWRLYHFIRPKRARKTNPQVVTQQRNLQVVKFNRMHMPKLASKICGVSTNTRKRVNNCGVAGASTLQYSMAQHLRGWGWSDAVCRLFREQQGSLPAVGQVWVKIVELIRIYRRKLRHHVGPDLSLIHI